MSESNNNSNTPFELQDGYGNLHKKSSTSKGRYDYFGECKMGDVKYLITGWKKENRHGNEYISFSLETPEERDERINANKTMLAEDETSTDSTNESETES